MGEILGIAFLLILGYSFGRIAEKKHYSSIVKREEESRNLIINNLKSYSGIDEIQESKLVEGSCVVALDYFKMFFALMINIVGGRMISYESLIDRARREAILRMKSEAEGYDFIINTKIETSSIGKNANNKNGVGAVEVLVYGTAVKVKDEARN